MKIYVRFAKKPLKCEKKLYIEKLMVSGQNRFLENFPASTSAELLAAGTKQAYFFLIVFAIIGFIGSLFVKRVRV